MHTLFWPIARVVVSVTTMPNSQRLELRTGNEVVAALGALYSTHSAVDATVMCLVNASGAGKANSLQLMGICTYWPCIYIQNWDLGHEKVLHIMGHCTY